MTHVPLDPTTAQWWTGMQDGPTPPLESDPLGSALLVSILVLKTPFVIIRNGSDS